MWMIHDVLLTQEHGEIMVEYYDSAKHNKAPDDLSEYEYSSLGEVRKVLEKGEVYTVEAIVGHRVLKRKKKKALVQYRVRWKGYGEATWEPASSFVSKDGMRMLVGYRAAHGVA